MKPKPTDEEIERAADKMIAGQPLTRRERRLLDSPMGDFAMGQVRAVIASVRAENDFLKSELGPEYLSFGKPIPQD
jgi:hypothetical protein